MADDFLGVHGHTEPYINLEPNFDLTALPDIHEEIRSSLSQFDVCHTGGSHTSMQIVPKQYENDSFIDYGDVIAAFSTTEFKRLMSLTDESEAIDFNRWRDLRYGEDGDVAINFQPMRYLKYRCRVYFPWTVFLEVVEGNDGSEYCIDSKIYTFNDINYHGVKSALFFRYSRRVDGVFTDAFRNLISKNKGAQSHV
ncbi:MAG: hypothetical protein M3R00_05430 [Pseudomonadota bacterium]|nr:hypothetical protein [Pseudomonadota bacterium]